MKKFVYSKLSLFSSDQVRRNTRIFEILNCLLINRRRRQKNDDGNVK